MEMQRTFGPEFGLFTMERVMRHRDDLVDCEDRDEKQRRGDCIETVDGYFYADPENAFACDSCGDCISEDLYDDKSGLCESCHDEEYSTCDSCRSEVRREDVFNSESGYEYCESCYSDLYSSCDACSCEVANDELRCNDGGAYCEGCYDANCCNEIEVPRHWNGGNGHKETGSLRKYGVELETSNCNEGYSWLDRNAFGVTEDCSVNGMEFVSAPLYGDDGLSAIRGFCRNANSSGFEVDSDCGFHLHCDLSDTTAEQRKAIALAYHYTRELWHEFIDSSRRNTYYSRLNWGGNREYWGRDEIVNGNDFPSCSERYIWINWQAFYKHSTVEVRSHHATLDGREVCNWVKAHIKFIDYVKDMTVGQVTRTFGNEDGDRQFAEFKHIWHDAELTEFYGSKRRAACAA